MSETGPTVTDEQIQKLAESAKPYTLAQLRWTPDRYQQGADAIELEHQRRMVSLRAAGVIAILCPVMSEEVAGVAIMTQPPESAQAIMAADPCVRAGMMTCEVLQCVSFPGDFLPERRHLDAKGMDLYPDEDAFEPAPEHVSRDLRSYRAAVDRSRRAVADHSLDDVIDLPHWVADDEPKEMRATSLRWVYQHMIEEYARHNGHADLLRERIDGVVGD